MMQIVPSAVLSSVVTDTALPAASYCAMKSHMVGYGGLVDKHMARLLYDIAGCATLSLGIAAAQNPEMFRPIARPEGM